MAVLNFVQLLLAAFVALVLYNTVLVIYRLFFHPLAKFPGNKLAASTLWYEFYYDVVCRGKLIWKIKEMHEKYGPIIRLNPNEIHIQDPDYFDEIYTNAPRKRDKFKWWTNLASAHTSAFSTVEHDLHRIRRGVLNPYFSKRSIKQLEGVIRSKIEKLSKRFEKAMATGEVVNLTMAFMALSTDIMTDYAFAEQSCYLDEDDFKKEWHETIMGGFESGALMRQFPWLLPVMLSLPPKVIEAMNPQIGFLMKWQAQVKRKVIAVLNSNPEEEKFLERKNMFHTLRDCDLPQSEKTMRRFCDEAEILLGAGSETTAATLKVLWFYLCDNPSILTKLREELATASQGSSQPIPSAIVENLPYLNAVIQEGIRLSYGVTIRTPRIAPNETLTYRGWTIPPGTPVSETIYFVLVDPTIFPEPEVFRPERWIENKRLDRYMVAFGKGSRQCLGINLAYAELWLTLSTLLPRFDFELYETTEKDVKCASDFFVAVPVFESKGVRVKVKPRAN